VLGEQVSIHQYKDAFGFDSLLETPTTEDVPKFLKVSKKDKQQAQQEPAQSNESKQNGHQSDKEQKPQEKASTEEGFAQENTFEDTIYRIAEQMENRDELAKQKQSEQATAIAQHLISQGVKDQDYSLPTTYISNWKRGKNVPKKTSKHYPGYRLWQLIIGTDVN